ncbi:hypothetical protein [Bacillus phage BC-T25]|nr:hypothetical protein [Bacillus phage BC-T25]
MKGLREVLIQFARENKVDLAAVDKFLGADVAPTGLEELLKLPEHQLTHYQDVAWIGNNTSEFLAEYMEPSRHSKVTLAKIVDYLNYKEEQAKKELDGDHIDQDDYEERMEFYKSIKEELVETKFGSVIYDW